MSSHRDPVTSRVTFTIDRADPVILISAEILREIFTNTGLEWGAQVRMADVIPVDDIYIGASLRITGTNRNVVYRITRRHDRHTYVGEWPD